ncbi:MULTISPECIES: c-type cytochrome [unclassified Nitrospina]|uniref:c-type cytochrome n=1 Tax=unclassified Nitrospina TaxID=2638683 RepID=UPI003F99BA5E
MNCLPVFRICFRLAISAFLLLLFLPAPPASAADESVARNLIDHSCSNCHRFEGEAKSRFELRAPDLMWAGVKFQRPWLVRWLMGQEDNVYQKNYRWDISQTPVNHPALTKEQAVAMADYFEKHLQDPRVKKDAIDLSQFTELHAQFGRELFKKHSCTGCHQIMEDDEKLGGPQSASFFNPGKRLNKDWIYRFNSNPPDFVPHSGEFVADVSGLGLYYITGFLATEGDSDFQFYEPWKSEHFQNASAERGATIYKEYCAQCHGAEGKGDGPAASGLDPKPAVHSELPLNVYPEDYLYNVIYYGGKSVGKSPYMPYWGLTLGDQGVADVIAYLRETFKGN